MSPFDMKHLNPEYERVFHENPDYDRNPSWVFDPPKGSRGNPSGAKLEGPSVAPVTDTARWLAPKKEV